MEVACVMLGAYLAAYKKYVPSRFVFNISEWDVHRKLQKAAQSDVLISPDIAQYPCVIGTNLMMDEDSFSYRILRRKKAFREEPMRIIVV